MRRGWPPQIPTALFQVVVEGSCRVNPKSCCQQERHHWLPAAAQLPWLLWCLCMAGTFQILLLKSFESANISAAWASQSCRIFENVFLQQCFPVLSFFIGKITCENNGDCSVMWPTLYMRRMEPSPAVLTQNKWGVQDRPHVSAGEFFSSPAKHTLWSDSVCCCVMHEKIHLP